MYSLCWLSWQLRGVLRETVERNQHQFYTAFILHYSGPLEASGRGFRGSELGASGVAQEPPKSFR